MLFRFQVEKAYFCNSGLLFMICKECSLQINASQKLINCKESKVAKNSDFSLIILGKDREFFKVLLILQMVVNF